MAITARHPRRSWLILLRPRWLAFHAVGIVSIVGMLWLGLWQLHRAESGNELSWAYTFEWPLFAIFAVYFWIKSVRDELSPTGSAKGGGKAEHDDVASRSIEGKGVGQSAADQSDDAYLELLKAQVQRHRSRGHAKWHGWR